MITAVWAAAANLLLLVVDKLWVSIFSLMLCFGFIYPVGSMVLFFRLAKRHGLLWYFYVLIMGLTVTEYILVEPYSIIIPNMIVMTALCLVFGCGIGSCFTDKGIVKAEREQRRLKRLGEDKPYQSIIDSGSNGKKKK